VRRRGRAGGSARRRSRPDRGRAVARTLLRADAPLRPAPADVPLRDPAARQHRDRSGEEHLTCLDDRGRGAPVRRGDRRVAYVPRRGGLRRSDAPLSRPHDPARHRGECARATDAGGPLMRPDTWPMFLNPAIWGFLFEGLRETIYLALASLAVSFPVALLFALGRLSRRRWVRWPSILYI